MRAKKINTDSILKPKKLNPRLQKRWEDKFKKTDDLRKALKKLQNKKVQLEEEDGNPITFTLTIEVLPYDFIVQTYYDFNEDKFHVSGYPDIPIMEDYGEDQECKTVGEVLDTIDYLIDNYDPSEFMELMHSLEEEEFEADEDDEDLDESSKGILKPKSKKEIEDSLLVLRAELEDYNDEEAIEMYFQFIRKGIEVDDLDDNAFNARNKKGWQVYFKWEGDEWQAYVQGYSGDIDIGTYPNDFNELKYALNSIGITWMRENDPKGYKSLIALSDVPGGELYKGNVEIEDLENVIEDLGNWSDEGDEDIDEAYEPKDLKRVKDFAKKSGGDFKKEVALARQMANTLTNVNKAIGRAEAAAEVYGGWNDIVQIFYDKAKELGYNGPPPAERLGVLKDHPILGSKLPKEQQYKSTSNRNPYIGRGRSWQGNAILPLGKVNLRTGESPIFNVYDTWRNRRIIVEVWVDPKGHDYTHLQGVETPSTGISSILKPKPKEEIDLTKRKFFNYRLIFTSGSQPNFQIGQKQNFYHDQNGNNIGQWQMVDYVPLKWMRELILPYGGNIAGYVYK